MKGYVELTFSGKQTLPKIIPLCVHNNDDLET